MPIQNFILLGWGNSFHIPHFCGIVPMAVIVDIIEDIVYDIEHLQKAISPLQ